MAITNTAKSYKMLKGILRVINYAMSYRVGMSVSELAPYVGSYTFCYLAIAIPSLTVCTSS